MLKHTPSKYHAVVLELRSIKDLLSKDIFLINVLGKY